MLDTGLKQPKEAEKHQLWVEGTWVVLEGPLNTRVPASCSYYPGFARGQGLSLLWLYVHVRSMHPMISPRNGIGILLTHQYTHLRSISKGE